MKKVLITGAGSYIGTSFANWVSKKYPGEFETEELDMVSEDWKKKDFSEYDVVFHVAGLAHQKETQKNAHLYYEINRDLAIETAEKAKKEGVGHFVILSSMSVYGKNTGIIRKDDHPDPKSHYGKSKYEADKKIEKLADMSFKVAILRPPMVYGEGCKGNYQLLKKFALMSPVFPGYVNHRSIVHIDVLCEYIARIINEKREGLYFPQNKHYACTAHLVMKIAEKNGKRIVMTRVFNPFIKIALLCHIKIVEKVFGDLVYER